MKKFRKKTNLECIWVLANLAFIRKQACTFILTFGLENTYYNMCCIYFMIKVYLKIKSTNI